MSRRLGIVIVAVLALAGAAYYVLRTHDASTAAPQASKPAEAVPSGAHANEATPPPRPPAHVTKFANAEERQRVAERIARAQAARAAIRAPDRPRLPETPTMSAGDLDHVATHVLVALKEAIPFLAECYKHSHLATGNAGAAATMTLTGDPDIGTLIDADQILDENGKPLPRELDDCLRGTLNSLQLPPLAEGDTVKLQYSFKFGDDE